MRRLLLVALASVVAASSGCASPRITLAPVLAAGSVREYRMTTEVTTKIDVPQVHSLERTVLRADVRIVVERSDAKGSTALMTVTPTAFERDGRRGEPPAAQQARILFDPAAQITGIQPVGRAAPPLGGSTEDIGALFGSTIARTRVHVADRWQRTVAPAAGASLLRRSRVASLAFVTGRRCAIVESVLSGPVQRTREAAGTTLRLTGVESANVTSAFAFDLGFPARVVSNAQGSFSIVGTPASQGGVVVRSTTTALLKSVGVRVSSDAALGPYADGEGLGLE